jgi:murein DD-endopeptidase MepM/ murein hydrolase activator NlpD
MRLLLLVAWLLIQAIGGAFKVVVAIGVFVVIGPGGAGRTHRGRRSSLQAAPVRLLIVLVVLGGAIDAIFGRVAAAGTPATLATAHAGDPFAGACRPVVTQPYGPTTFPGEPIVNGVRFHTGIDLACPAGTPVHTVTGGTAHVTLGYGGGFGNNVDVELQAQLPGDGAVQRYFVRYAHLASVSVPDGASVQAGDVIGREGSTGYSTGPHLHFEVDRGAPSVQRSIDPSSLLAVA